MTLSAHTAQMIFTKCIHVAISRYLILRADSLSPTLQELIVVASLIDKIPNLAGLARSCEVFQASGLALSNPAVVNDPEFKQISVTAEKWVPIMEVPESGLSSYLARKRDEGWSLVSGFIAGTVMVKAS